MLPLFFYQNMAKKGLFQLYKWPSFWIGLTDLDQIWNADRFNHEEAKEKNFNKDMYISSLI